MSAWVDGLRAQSVQVALVFVIVLALDALVARKGSVALRTALWAAFFAKLVLPPTLASPLSVARVLDRVSAVQEITTPGDTAPTTVPPLGLLILWVIGCAASCVLAVRRMRSSRAEWLDDSQPAPAWADAQIAELAPRIGLRRAPRLRVRDGIAGAASVGLVAPVVVVPTELLESRVALEHVLLHELAHVRRRDGLRAAAWTLARCVYWFHPFVHVAARRAALVHELACDEIAANAASAGSEGFRRTLLDLARPLAATPALTAFGGAGSMITARLERLERPLRAARRFDVLPALAFAVLCLCCVPLGARAVEIPRLPSLSEVDGCMRKRFLVMAEIAKQEHVEGAASLE